MKKVLLFTMLLLLMGVSSAMAQGTYTKWKIVEDPATLAANDEVVVVDLTTSSALANNPAYEEGNTVSKESPSAAKVTLKEELDRISSDVADTIVWTMDRPDSKYTLFFLNAESKKRYLFNSDQNLRVGFCSDDNASKRKFDIDNGLFHMKIQTDEEVYTDYHVGVKAASGIMAMMSGNKWELIADAEGEISSDIAATKMMFFKKVVTSLPDPTLRFPKHDYEADLHAGANSFEAPAATIAEGGDITYYCGNTDVAEVDASTGAVTLKKRGTVRIYAYVAATANYDDYLTSYVLRIDDSEAAGGRNHPFTVAQALDYAKGDHAEETANGVCYFVKGIVSSVGGAMAGMEDMGDMMEMMSGMMEGMEGMEGFDMSAMLSMFMGEQEPGTVTYAISDNGAAHDELNINNGRGLQLADITADDLSVGDWVTVYGPLEYSEDNDMMSMFGGMGGNGGDQEDKRTVKVARVNYMQEHVRNLITKDIVLYYGQTKQTDELFSITDMFGGSLVTNTNAQNNSLPKTSLKLGDTDVAYWAVNGTDSLLTPKKSGIIMVTVNAPVLLANGDTVKMKRRFNLDVRDRQVLPAGTMVGNYELVTNVSQLQPDDKLLIVATIDNKPKVLNRKAGASSGGDSSNPMMSMMGGGNNGSNITIGANGKITEVPDDALILTLEQDGDKWLLQTGRTADYVMTYLYVSDTDGGSGGMSIPGMGSSGASLKTGIRSAINDSCQVAFTFLQEKNDSVKIQFNFSDREKDGNPVTAKNVIRFEKSTMSSSFGGFEPESDKATLPRLYRLVQADQYDVTITSALWATIISAYDVTLPEAVMGYVVTATDGSKATLDKVTALKKGVPYVLSSENAGTYTLVRATDAVEAPATNLLDISDDSTGNGVFVLANTAAKGPGFYKWMGGLLGAGRVYLSSSGAASSAREFIPFYFNDGATSVGEQLTIDSDSAESPIYNLSGQRVTKLQKGLYIVKGQKVVIK